MSRPKSPATIEREQDREIRRKRRAIKRQEHERRRSEREARKQRRENARNGGPILVKSDPEYFGYHRIKDYKSWDFCERCRRPFKEDFMAKPGICIGCYEGGQSDNEDQTAMGGTSSVPGQGKKEKAQPLGQVGQPSLQFEV